MYASILADLLESVYVCKYPGTFDMEDQSSIYVELIDTLLCMTWYPIGILKCYNTSE